EFRRVLFRSAAARASGVPVVAQVSDKWLYFSLHDASALLPAVVRTPVVAAQRLVGPLLRRAARPTRVVAISEFIRCFYVSAGLSANEVEAIHLGVPLGEFSYRERPPPPPPHPPPLLSLRRLS